MNLFSHDMNYNSEPTLKFLIRVLHFLFVFGIFFYLHGLIRTYMFIYFWEKYPPTFFFRNKYQKIPTYTTLLRPTRLLISEKTSQLHSY